MDWTEVWAQVLPPLTALLVAFIMWGLRKLFKKIDWDVTVKQDAALRELIRAAIGGAEELAAKALKVDETKVGGAEKLDWVREQVTKLWPDAIPADLDGLIHQELARIYGVGATGLTVVSSSRLGVATADTDPSFPTF